MNTEELWSLCNWVQLEVVDRRIPEYYANLANLVQRNNQPNVARQPLEAPKNTLLEALRLINLWSLTKEQLSFLDKLKLASHLGEGGANEIEDVLFRNALDIATAASKLQENSNEIAAAVAKFAQIKAGLDGVVELMEPAPTDEVLLRVKFAGDAQINNVVNLRGWADDWYDIGRGIAMAHNESPETIRVIGASRGSIIIDLATAYGVAKTTSAIILEALRVADRVLDIVKKAEEIKAMRLSNKKIAQEIQAEATKEREDGIADITAKIVALVGLKKDEGDKITALEKAIKTLVNFISKGGVVDCVLPPEGSPETGNAETVKLRAELASSFQEIRQLEDKQRRIGQDKA